MQPGYSNAMAKKTSKRRTTEMEKRIRGIVTRYNRKGDYIGVGEIAAMFGTYPQKIRYYWDKLIREGKL
jgi:ribosome biogenesis protein Nip4